MLAMAGRIGVASARREATLTALENILMLRVLMYRFLTKTNRIDC